MSRRDDRLTGLDLLFFELEDQLTIQANQMIMVLVGHREFVARVPVAEVSLMRNTCLNEELEGAIHRRRPRGRRSLLNRAQKLLHRDVVRTDKHLQDLHPLARVLHPLVVDVTFEPCPRRVERGHVGSVARAASVRRMRRAVSPATKTTHAIMMKMSVASR